MPQSEFLTAQDPNYKYQNARMPYRSEKIRISPEEKAMLLQWAKSDSTSHTNRMQSQRKKIIVDTDIGTDIDDALALLMLLHLPSKDYELLGITTVYGYSHLRAAVTEKIVQGCYPVIAGESTPLGTHRPVWHTGTEGLGVLEQQEIENLQKKADFVVANNVPLAPITSLEEAKQNLQHQAAIWIIEQIKKYPGEVTIACLGALSNIAVALRLDPSIVPLISRIVFTGVGGSLPVNDLPEDHKDYGINTKFYYPTHNLSCDTLAAIEVFRSGIPIDIVNNPLTTKLWWGKAHSSRCMEIEEAKIACLSLLEATAPVESAIVGKMLKEWFFYRSAIFRKFVHGTCPHDPLTVAEAVYRS